MATYKIMTNPKSKHEITVADLSTMEFKKITVELLNASRDEKRLTAEIRRRIPTSLAWGGKIDKTVEDQGTFRLRTDLFMALGDFSTDGKNWTLNPIAAKLVEQLQLPEIKTRKRGSADDDSEDADVADDAD